MDHKRLFWQHLTNKKIFIKYILPEIKQDLFNYVFVDYYAWEWNLILPILKFIKKKKRVEYFKNHIFLFDIQDELVNKAIENAWHYWIPKEVAKQNIKQNDSLSVYPKIKSNLPIFHITNPPYLYIWYIKKHEETQHYLDYFKNEFSWLQDLYQVAMFQDMKNNISKNIYIVPSNFLFSASWTNKVRTEYLESYDIQKAIIFEEKIFDFTGQHVWIFFFNKKQNKNHDKQKFEAIKINWYAKKRNFELRKTNNYRWGSEFIDFCKKNQQKNINVDFYLMEDYILKNKWTNKICWYDINNKKHKEYFVSPSLYNKIKKNHLYIRTIDTGKNNGRIWLYDIRKDYNADCIVITNGKTYRTYPIQVFLKSEKPFHMEELKKYFNLTLESFREKYDSDFLTTFMYSENAEYVRKFIGLTYTRKLIQTFKI